ncbi:virulence-associated E family protein [Aurantimonas sp. E1-2-R+4]|uniref:virulence-associated E family protein n=1 Tax=Aurantimonas sp. E1-2-R+4 TaxID=3113714 RepID=UPI002F94A2FD
MDAKNPAYGVILASDFTIQNLPNAQEIINNDPRLFGAIAFDDFMQRVVLRRDIMSKMESTPPCYCRDKLRGDIWQDVNDVTVRSILAAPNGKGKKGYGIDKLAERDLASAILTVALRNRFHPVKDYLWGCELRGWDRRQRVERLFIDYLGCPDTPYYRQTALMVMVAAVARIFEPGHKFDFSPVLEGEGGIRKSTFIEYLYGPETFGELTCDLKDTQRIAETIGGLWALEFPEMTSFHKSDYNDAKQFLSAKQDQVRMAYDRRPSVFPRQATFWGTTNNTKYLKDPTGNRRWWPIHAKVSLIDTDRLLEERDQIWAEALAIYKAMRRDQPHGDLPLYLSDPTAKAEAELLQTGARQRQMYEQWVEEIRDWLDDPIPLQQLWNEYGHELFADVRELGFDPERVTVQRVVVRDSDIAKHVLREEGVIKNQQTIQNFDAAMGMIPEWVPVKTLTGKDRPYYFGVQARWKVRDDATAEEIALGYRVVDDLV